jgi:hypothetical protein
VIGIGNSERINLLITALLGACLCSMFQGCQSKGTVEDPRQGASVPAQIEAEIIVHRRGSRAVLDPENSHFQELRTLCEKTLVTSNNRLWDPVDLETVSRIRKEDMAIEVSYRERLSFTVEFGARQVEVTRLLIPLSGYYLFKDKTLTIFCGYPYAPNPFMNDKGYDEITELLDLMGFQTR